MLTKQQLLSLLADTESHQAERTTSTIEMDKFCQAICAFSNDVSGSGKSGYLIIGAHDNGKISGLKVDDRLLLQISNIRTDGNILPQVHFKGKDRAGDIINEYKFSGNLCKSLVKIDNFIETSVAAKRPIPVSVLREETFSKYPYWATRELLMNAIMHRDYESNAPVQFYEYDDRVEVQNPGGLYGKVSPDNFPNISDYRNPYIAEAMKVLGYVNRFSRGVYRVQAKLSIIYRN